MRFIFKKSKIKIFLLHEGLVVTTKDNAREMMEFMGYVATVKSESVRMMPIRGKRRAGAWREGLGVFGKDDQSCVYFKSVIIIIRYLFTIIIIQY